MKPAKPGSKRARILILNDHIERLEEHLCDEQRAREIAEMERDEARRWAGPEREEMIARYEAAIRSFNENSGSYAMITYERDAARQEAAEWRRRYWELKGIQP